MIQDLHSHTYYSFCGKDRPEAVVEAAIAGGIELLGICDHNHGVGYGLRSAFKAPEEIVPNDYSLTLQRYFDHMSLIKERYADRIRILRGIEISTRLDLPKLAPSEQIDFSLFDYCLVESLDEGDGSLLKGDIFSFARRLNIPHVGLAHTDLLGYLRESGTPVLPYLSRMAEEGIFWEMNVSYDSIHKYRRHDYMLRFFSSPEEQELVRRSGLRLSVGFDGHRVEDYRPDLVRDACARITEMGIPLAFEEGSDGT